MLNCASPLRAANSASSAKKGAGSMSAGGMHIRPTTGYASSSCLFEQGRKVGNRAAALLLFFANVDLNETGQRLARLLHRFG